jgi:hypothetical protein
MRTDNVADIRLGAMLEICIFYISQMYEFSHSLDPNRTWAGIHPANSVTGNVQLTYGGLADS